jgi:hypothetical protein
MQPAHFPEMVCSIPISQWAPHLPVFAAKNAELPADFRSRYATWLFLARVEDKDGQKSKNKYQPIRHKNHPDRAARDTWYNQDALPGKSFKKNWL